MKGYICPCCGLKIEEEAGSESPLVLFCQPCKSDGILSTYSLPAATPVVSLDASAAFQGLTNQEKLYAYWIGKASWEGSLICLTQCSPESRPLFSLFLAVFSSTPIEDLIESAQQAGLKYEEVESILLFVAAFFGNLGNYKSFGDTKFIPVVSPEKFRRFCTASRFPQDSINVMLDFSVQRLYSLSPRDRQVWYLSLSLL
jgi:dipeptidyl-peptidase III